MNNGETGITDLLIVLEYILAQHEDVPDGVHEAMDRLVKRQTDSIPFDVACFPDM